MSERDPTISGALIDTVTDQGAIDALSALGEAAFDSVVEDGLVRDIPIVGTVVGFARAGLALRDRLFLRKLTKFATRLQEIPEVDRQQFASDLKINPAQRAAVGDSLVILLDRLDDLAKPQLVGNAFAAYVRGQIGFPEFQRLARAIDRVALPSDLQHLKGWSAALRKVPADAGFSLQNAGLLEARDAPNTRNVDGTMDYMRTNLGQLCEQVVLS